jgi:outer membrane protein assembly factor BamB
MTFVAATFQRALAFVCLGLSPAVFFAADWTDWRGPNRDGRSPETDLPTSWSPAGENLLWKAPYPGRSTPVIMGDRLYALNAAGEGASLQERVLCLNADTGETIWEYRYNVFHSDVPPRRIAWSSPVVDPASGNVFTFGVAATLTALSADGELLWQRSLIEDFGALSTHGGRTVSPIVEGDLVIVSGVMLVWGEHAAPRHRFLAFNKNTGECLWISAPGGQPFDTTYSTPIGVDIDGQRLIIAGSGDGSVVALKPQTGEKMWRYPMSKRGVNTEVVVYQNTALVSHGEENLDTSEMGLVAAINAAGEGELGESDVRWKARGVLGGYSSPVIDQGVLYQIDNGSNLHAFDLETGERLWMHNLGTIQKASPVIAEGKIYVGNENGDFFILKPSRRGCEVLDKDRLGSEESPEIITASPAISNGRVFVVTETAMYCFGKKTAGVSVQPAPPPAKGSGAATFVQVTPTELILEPGESVQFRARLYDSKGRFLRDSTASWELNGLDGEVNPDGRFTVAVDAGATAGVIHATVDGITGAARARVVPPLPWDDDFEDMKPGPPPRGWINATGKFQVRDVGGNQVLVKLADNPAAQRARVTMGPAEWKDYTVQVDVQATERRRQMGDAGIVAQRYTLVLFGNHQRLEIHPWQADPRRSVHTNFPWKKDTWYRMKLRVENLPDGKVKLQGKAWPAADPEPEGWTLEHVDPVPNREGSPGLYADAPFEISFDNFKVTPNE